jgi:hypothetical protein
LKTALRGRPATEPFTLGHLIVTQVDIIPLLRDAAPQWKPDSDDPVFVQLGSLGRYIVECVASGQTNSLQPVFDAVERLHIEGDAYTREAATIGILEAIQNIACHANIPHDAFEPFLRPESQRWWDKLNDFWEGQSSTVA